MRSVIVSLLLTLRASLRNRAALQLEILALRHQLHVVNRSRLQRVRLTPADRVLWVWLSKRWNDWRAAVVIAVNETGLSDPVSGALPPVANTPFAGQGLATAAADRATKARRGRRHSSGRRPTPSLRPPRGVVTPSLLRHAVGLRIGRRARLTSLRAEPTSEDSDMTSQRQKTATRCFHSTTTTHTADRPTDQSGPRMEFSVRTAGRSRCCVVANLSAGVMGPSIVRMSSNRRSGGVSHRTFSGISVNGTTVSLCASAGSTQSGTLTTLRPATTRPRRRISRRLLSVVIVRPPRYFQRAVYPGQTKSLSGPADAGTRPVIAQQIVQESLAILVSHPRTPVCHLLNFPVPLSTAETLLTDDVLVMTGQAGILETGGLLAVRGGGLYLSASSGNVIDHVHTHARDHIPAITARVPLLIERLSVAGNVARPRQNGVVRRPLWRPAELPLSPAERRSLTHTQRRGVPGAPAIDAHVDCRDRAHVTAPGDAANRD